MTSSNWHYQTLGFTSQRGGEPISQLHLPTTLKVSRHLQTSNKDDSESENAFGLNLKTRMSQ